MSTIERQPDGDRKSTKDILAEQIEAGLNELHRETNGLFLSSLSAGLDMGFGPLLMAVMYTVSAGHFSPPVEEILLANMYSIGFIFVILGRSELFTEHTTRAVLPVLDRRASLGELGRLWVIVYVGNIVGGLVFSAVAVAFAPAIDIVETGAFVHIAENITTYSPFMMFVAAILAGWLMGLLSWLYTSGQGTSSRIFFVWLVSAVIGFAHLPHAIAGNIEVTLGLFASPAVTWAEYGRFLLMSTAGNIVGGSVFVSLLKYGHVVRGGG